MNKNAEGNLKFLLSPASIAVIGASRNPSKIGAIILRNIIFNGYPGKVYPINPYTQELYNYKTYPNLKSIKEKVELVVICTPSETVEAIVQECIDIEVKAVMVVGTGYAESGKQGIELQQSLVKMCKDAEILFFGPNTSGIVNVDSVLNVSMIANLPEKGNSSLITQSGSIASELVDYARDYDLGLKEIINVGNKAQLSEIDFLNHYNSLSEKDSLHAVGLAMENIAEGKNFINIVSKLVLKTVVIAMIVGKSEYSKEEIKLHTGVVRQNNYAIDLALKQSGCLMVENEHEMFDLLLGFSWQPVMKGNTVAVVTNTGGGAVIAADEIGKQDLNLFQLTSDLHNFINQQLGRATQFDQVIDLEGKSIVDRIGTVVDVVLAEKGVHAVLVILAAHNVADLTEISGILGLLSRIHKKTIVVAFMGGGHIEEGKKILAKQFIPSFDSIDKAIKVLGQMHRYYQIKQLKTVANDITSASYLKRFNTSSLAEINNLIKNDPGKSQQGKVSYTTLRQIINKAGFITTQNQTFSTIEELYDAAESMGMPVVFKCPNGKKDVACSTREDLRKQFKQHLNCGRDYSDIVDSTLDIVHGHTLERVYTTGNLFEIILLKDDYSNQPFLGLDKDTLEKLSFGYTMNINFIGFGRRNQIFTIATENKQEIMDLISKDNFIQYTGVEEKSWFKLYEKFIWSVQNSVRIVNSIQNINELMIKGMFDGEGVVLVDYSCSVNEQ